MNIRITLKPSPLMKKLGWRSSSLAFFIRTSSDSSLTSSSARIICKTPGFDSLSFNIR